MLESAPAPAQVYVERRPFVRIKIIYVSLIPEILIKIWPVDLENELDKDPKIGAIFRTYGGVLAPCAGICIWR